MSERRIVIWIWISLSAIGSILSLFMLSYTGYHYWVAWFLIFSLSLVWDVNSRPTKKMKTAEE